ncbi:hypothetical protein F4827_003094 [Paraburkholderia bannensis]|uniref:LysM domain-containing protein n=1 Tax=Paraburkholderia bannensis TaxID=765414 RepID=A0A7W9TY27_9BURK|nr:MULTISPECIES: hypothetical protein [Paraburkholderia]MBB3258226.1 hypothetical protein [Paraburkholderia sp. WP4_3_2]MBB6103239.1 hypothetical protein [Paraburkholderia bannensis]
MSDITVVLGDFQFQDFEVPERIPFNTEQRLVIKKMVGGVRDIQMLGPDWPPIVWSGTFMPTADGQSALDRARTVEQMVNAAQPVSLSWDELYFLVVIRSFEPDYRFYQIPYRITCEVLQDLTAPIYADAGLDADDVINGDLDSANALTASSGDSTLSSLMGTLSTAVGNVKSFVGATMSEVATVLQPLNNAARYVSTSISQVDSLLASVGVPAGVLPSLPIAQNVSKFESIFNATTLQMQYTQVNALLGRMQRNLAQVSSSGRVVTVGGGNLFDLASKEYGDPSAWTQIAQANNLSDPTLVGVNTLIIPPYSNGTSGGILSS